MGVAHDWLSAGAQVLEGYEKRKDLVIAGLMKELGCTKAFAESTQANLFTWHTGTALAEVRNANAAHRRHHVDTHVCRLRVHKLNLVRKRALIRSAM